MSSTEGLASSLERRGVPFSDRGEGDLRRLKLSGGLNRASDDDTGGEHSRRVEVHLHSHHDGSLENLTSVIGIEKTVLQ